MGGGGDYTGILHALTLELWCFGGLVLRSFRSIRSIRSIGSIGSIGSIVHTENVPPVECIDRQRKRKRDRVLKIEVLIVE